MLSELTMDGVSCRFLSWLVCVTACVFILSVNSAHSWCPPPPSGKTEAMFKQKTNKFWEFEEKSNTWVEISLPFDLMSCINGSCVKVGSIEELDKKHGHVPVSHQKEYVSVSGDEQEESNDPVLPVRKRISLTRMTDASLWITGQSGSIYERFWNGVQWVIAPHELPMLAGYAAATFIVNQTILALSEAGILYQLQLNEHAQPIWTEILFMSDQQHISTEERAQSQVVHTRNGIVSYDRKKLFLSTANRSLLEITELQPLRWNNHGRPPGGDVSAVADTGNVRPGILFTDGLLVERRLHRRKWKWDVHGTPKGQRLSTITQTQLNELNGNPSSLFLTTTTGNIFEYQLPKYAGGTHGNIIEGLWINHMHPEHAKVARSVQGIQVQIGRIVFPLDDGRLGELHLPGIGGDGCGPTPPSSIRRKVPNKYEWSVLDAPETEGWNAEYCTEEHGPTNCITGTKSVAADSKPNDLSSTTASRRRKAEDKQHYISFTSHESDGTESYNFLTKSIDQNFHMRVMHADRSLFLVTESGLTFEYLNSEGVWLWLRHEHTTAMKGALGSYNGSLYLGDAHGNLLIRERNGDELSWINCTAMRKGRQVASGSPWDGIPGLSRRVTIEDALFFVNKRGRLLQFTVALRKFKWKDCQSPPDTKIAFIVDQEVFRRNIIFVVGRDGRLYQYNRITELWHKHYQSPHLALSRSPGAAMRSSHLSLTGSIFMISEQGGLVEYHFNSQEGWEWVEHGTPHRDVNLVGAPGPSFDGTQLFVIGSDGRVYRRHLEQRTWKWTSHGHPSEKPARRAQGTTTNDDERCTMQGNTATDKTGPYDTNNFMGNCDDKVAAVRPVPFSDDSVVFKLRDGRLAEMRRPAQSGGGGGGGDGWSWTRIVGTPASTCLTSYWTAVAT